jgi:hypothetical protein
VAALNLSAAAILATASSCAMARSGGTGSFHGGGSGVFHGAPRGVWRGGGMGPLRAGALGHPDSSRGDWRLPWRRGYGGRGHGSYPGWGSGFDFGDSCWQVRPIYSISGAWLDNRRVNVCD